MLNAIYRISMALFGKFAAKCNFMEINSKNGKTRRKINLNRDHKL